MPYIVTLDCAQALPANALAISPAKIVLFMSCLSFVSRYRPRRRLNAGMLRALGENRRNYCIAT
jgi:hypothetical protein